MGRSRTALVLLGLIACGFTGGSSFIFVKLLVGEITPLQLAAARVALAGLFLTVIALSRRPLPSLSSPVLRGAVVLAVLDTATPFLLIAWASVEVTSSTAALLISTMPLFTTLIGSQTLRDESITLALVLGLACALVGIVVLAGPGALDFGNSSSIAILALLGSAFCYAGGAVYSRVLLRSIDPISLTALKLSIAALVLVPIAITIDGLSGFGSLNLVGWLGLFEVCVISTGIGRCILQWLIATAGSVRASFVTYIIPVVTLALSWTFLDERLQMNTLAGAMLVLAGTAMAMYGSALPGSRVFASRVEFFSSRRRWLVRRLAADD